MAVLEHGHDDRALRVRVSARTVRAVSVARLK
jgi:hypothetical protein